MNDIEVVCIGSAKYDTVTRIDHVLDEDERIVTESIINAVGGNAATAAVTLARLGVSVALMTVVGCDAGGDYILARLEEERVDTRYVERRPGVATAQSINIAIESTGCRAIITVVPPHLGQEAVASVRAPWIHVDSDGFLVSNLLRAAKPVGSRISVDAGIPVPGLNLSGIDLYAPTVERLRADFGSGPIRELMERAVAHGAVDVVATNGASGYSVLSEGCYNDFPAFKGSIVSTLGAGDVFHGALVAGLVEGLDLEESARQASAAALLACRALDGQSAIPDRTELQAFLSTAAERTLS